MWSQKTTVGGPAQAACQLVTLTKSYYLSKLLLFLLEDEEKEDTCPFSLTEYV